MRASLVDKILSAKPAAGAQVLDTGPMTQAPLPIPGRSVRGRETRRSLLLKRSWSWALATVVFGAVAKRRWDQMDAMVPGVDAGVWLDLGRALFGGEGRVTAGVYPPLVPFLLHVGQTLVGPLPAARVLAAASLFAVMVATYAVANSGLHRLTALAVALSTGLASSVIEPIAYGGYPQNLAFALLVLAAFALTGYLREGHQRMQAWGVAALSATALTHHAYFALACLALVLVWLGWLSTRPPRSRVLSRTAGAAVVGLVALLCFAPTLGGLVRAGYRPPFGGDRGGHVGALTYALREAPRLWLFVLLLGVVCLAATWRRRNQLWLVSAALMVASALPFALVGEPRLVPPFILGACLGVSLALERVGNRLTNPQTRTATAAATLALPLLLWSRADVQALDYFGYYRVVDGPLLQAAQFVDRHAGAGLVVVRQDHRGWPVGWWFEGLTDARIVVGSDERWLGFPQERERAELAAGFFARRRTGTEAMALAAEADVDLLVFRKWEWIGWERWLAEPDPAVEVVYDDGEFMVLDVAPEPSPPPVAEERPSPAQGMASVLGDEEGRAADAPDHDRDLGLPGLAKQRRAGTFGQPIKKRTASARRPVSAIKR